jgi:hypothetical protein
MSSASTSTDFVTGKLQNAREALVAKGLYLGSSGVLDAVTWERNGRADHLVTVEAAATAAATRKAYVADPEAPEPTAPAPAVLSAVVFVPSEDYWLTSCGMWKGPTEAARSFADVKPTCMGEAPEHEVFSGDFNVVIKNMGALFEKARTKGFKEIKGVIVKSGDKSKLKFRHVLFDVTCDSFCSRVIADFSKKIYRLSKSERMVNALKQHPTLTVSVVVGILILTTHLLLTTY